MSYQEEYTYEGYTFEEIKADVIHKANEFYLLLSKYLIELKEILMVIGEFGATLPAVHYVILMIMSMSFVLVPYFFINIWWFLRLVDYDRILTGGGIVYDEYEVRFVYRFMFFSFIPLINYGMLIVAALHLLQDVPPMYYLSIDFLFELIEMKNKNKS